MTAKKYKTLKTASTLTNLNNIFKNSLFFCFIDAKCFNNKTIYGILEEDQKFYGGSKVTYQIEDKKKCIVSSKLIKIL